jgi:probable rRNA maturation factor
MAEIEIYTEHPKIKFDVKPLKKTVLKVLKGEGCTNRGLLLVLTSNEPLRQLNKRWRRKNKPTDVLSFGYSEPDFLGEVIISLDKAKIQAAEYGVTLKNEVCRLAIHGVLHLLGYRHGKKSDRTAMEIQERKYIK